MYEKFTERARNVMVRANKEAHRLNHEYIGTEHILLGLISDGTSVAANLLKNLGITLRKVRIDIEVIIAPGSEGLELGRLPETPRAKKVIEFAIEEARNFNHNYVGTEHLLLGLMREDAGVAAQILMNLGLRLDALRAEVASLLGHPRGSLAHQSSRESADQKERPIQDEEIEMRRRELLQKKKRRITRRLRPELRHLPESAREIIGQFDCQIKVVKEEKEKALGALEFEKAAELRDLEYKLRKLRDEFLNHWPKSEAQ